LAQAAEALGDLREQLVFVGGCATALLITDPGAAPVRVTEDVDAIVAITALPDYHRLADSLAGKGFKQSAEEADPPYRWRRAGVKLDVMPIDPGVLGFTNRWYEPAVRTASRVALAKGLSIRLITPPYFVGTKLEAFLDRGSGDYFESHDLEDVLSVIDGRPELTDELKVAESALRIYVAQIFANLLKDEDFLNALPGLVMDGSPQVRRPVVLERLRTIAQMREG
jgi:predicted nucleotidyltransferase